MRENYYYVYILTNWNNKILYTGVTNDLERRMTEHKQGLIDGFTKRYHVHKLVYCEYFRDINDAIAYEKTIKGWKREKKTALIEENNPFYRDLSDGWDRVISGDHAEGDPRV